MKILCISGSVRAESTCVVILKTLAERHKHQADFHIYDKLASLPHFDPDAEENGIPEIVRDFREEVAAADAVILCTTEYVFSPPAILKNALEWCVGSTVFSAKPTAMIVASGAGEKTFEGLALILRTIQTKITADTMLHLKGMRAKMLGDNKLTDADTLGKLDAVFRALLTP